MQIIVNRDTGPSPEDAEVEIVERKGLGHPDSICDSIAEAFSSELSRLYLEQVGAILHHNVDKALLVAGASQPRFGGGRVVTPMQLILAGQARLEMEGQRIDVAGLADDVARSWFAEHLHCVDATRDLIVSAGVRPGSRELGGLFESGGRRASLANDTSCGVGFAPLTELECLVLDVERKLNSTEVRADAPALGEDVKVMAFRRESSIQLIVAVAMIDGALSGASDYLEAKEQAAGIAFEAAKKVTSLPLEIDVNVGDDVPAGRMYLTVTGTSAEAGDDGQTGRGNRANGLITPCRPMTMESIAGKNPVTHVGKLYNFAASLIAECVAEEISEVRNAECRIVSAIGQPVVEPQILEVRVVADPVRGNSGLAHEVEGIARRELEQIPEYAGQILARTLRMNRWPLRE